jgi:catalase-peroxidase
VESFAVLEPLQTDSATTGIPKHAVPAEEMLVDKAQLLTLTAPEMTVLVGGMRVLNTNFDQSQHGVFTKRPEALTNDFFVNLLDLGTTWKATSDSQDVFEGRDRTTGERKWTAPGLTSSSVRTPNSGHSLKSMPVKTLKQFVRHFVAAWNKVMNLDRFD